MSNFLNVKTPAQDQALVLKSEYGIDSQGLTNLHQVYWNLPRSALYEEMIFRREGIITRTGSLAVETGRETARSPNDKYIVKEPSTEKNIWWGEHNRPLSPEKFGDLFNRLQGFLQGKDVFVQDCYVGADREHRISIRIITELAWHSMFARNMFIFPATNEEYRRHIPDFTVLCIPSFKGIPQIDGTRTATFIALSFDQALCIIGNTAYAGEIKKAIFTLLNYKLPLKGVMSMHCSANIGKDGDTAIFFGLSGTGKTTLSADPKRRLIGDDEHGWNDKGVFNFEGGCYAKVIRLSPSAEPQIYASIRRFGAILENVAVDKDTRLMDLDDDSVTENTRASYPLDYIENAVPEKQGGHPKNLIILTCDAYGVMPPVAKLTPDQALYQFVSGYTSKIAGTEIELGREPEITFSVCLGAPFMIHQPAVYVNLLKQKISRYNVQCWLINTGWIGGAFGIGKRISIEHTRALLNAVLGGTLVKEEFWTDPVFGFQVPKSCGGVPEGILNPAESWPSKKGFMAKYRQLALHFQVNFKKFEESCPELAKVGPRVRTEAA